MTQWCRNRGLGGHCPLPQYLAAQLTLFQLGEGWLSPLITTAPSQIYSPSGITVTNLWKIHFCFWLQFCIKYSGRGSKFNSWFSMCMLGSFPMVFNKFMYSFDVVLKEELGYLNSTKASQRVDLHGYFTTIWPSTAQFSIIAITPRPNVVVISNAKCLCISTTWI